jgi:HK97 family phage portal protein
VDSGREYDQAHPVARLVQYGPNQHQGWPDWIEWTLASVLLRGNALSHVVTDNRGAPVELRPIPWDWVSVELLPNGRLVYEVTEITSMSGGTGASRRLLQSEVFHLRDRTDDGLVGKSRLQRAASVVSAGLSVQQFANSMYKNGINPSGALEVDGRLSPEAYNRLTDSFRNAFAGSQNAAKALILDQGVKWKQISISPEDAELLASRRFTVEELARLYGKPPPIIGDLSHGTFTNTETVGRWFAQHTLTPWIRKIESEFKRSVFSAASRATHELEIDLSGFMRGDPDQRWRAHEIAVKNGILTPNEVRESEGWNPLPAGETLGVAGT